MSNLPASAAYKSTTDQAHSPINKKNITKSNQRAVHLTRRATFSSSFSDYKLIAWQVEVIAYNEFTLKQSQTSFSSSIL